MTETQGIVLSILPYRESDLIVKVITDKFGKISLFASAARKSGKRFSGGLDIFSCGIFNLVKKGKGSLFTIENFKSTKPLLFSREPDLLLPASVLLEAVDAVLPEGQVNSLNEDFIDNEEQHYFKIIKEGINKFEELYKSKNLNSFLLDGGRIVFEGIRDLLILLGILEDSYDGKPSAKNLHALCIILEKNTNRKLKASTAFWNRLGEKHRP